MSKQSIKKKRISKDCWNLDQAFLKWLGERLPVYKKEAGKVVDLKFHEFEYNSERMTQEEGIDRMLELLHQIDGLDSWDKEYEELTNELLDLWKLVFAAMWY